jgi:tetratricopeptide (TPR) repeat protein
VSGSTPVRRSLLIAAGPVVGALVGALTNVITSRWNWWLFGALVLLVSAAAVLLVLTEREAGQRAEVAPPAPVGPLDPALVTTGTGISPAAVAPPTAVYQLPPDVAHFTGRERQVRRLRELLDPARPDAPDSFVVATLSGKGGVGKTALAVHVAHWLSPSFPDGQLYVDLRGVGGTALAPAEVLARFLRALGVDEGVIPDELEDRVNLYRSRLAGRRALIVLDNAASENQVRLLLPGSRSCAVIVTSRRPLSALAATELINLDVLDPDEAVELLTRLVGADRIAAESEAAHEIVRLCGHLPLAIRVVGARLVARPHWTMADLGRLLRDERRRLSELRAGDLEVRTTFLVSYDDLDEPCRRAFRVLGLLRAADFPAWVAAAALDLTPDEGAEIVENLCEAQLVEVGGRAEAGLIRYRFHDLIRDFARERAMAEDDLPLRRGAVERVLGGYLTLAERADHLLEPGLRNIGDGTGLRWRSGDEQFIGTSIAGDPQGWFATESSALVSGVEQAFEYRLYDQTWELAGLFAACFAVRAHPSEWEHSHLVALEATAASGDQRGEAFIRRSLGRLYRYTGRWAEAEECYRRALALFHQSADRLWEGVTYRNLGDLYRDMDDNDRATGELTEALRIFEAIGDRQWEAATLISLGETYLKQGRIDEAVDCFNRCLPIFEAGGHRWWRAVALVAIGDAHRVEGAAEDALTHLRAGLEIFEDLGDDRRIGVTLVSIGAVYSRLGRADEARGCLDRSLVTFRAIGDRLWEARTAEALAQLPDAAGLTA